MDCLLDRAAAPAQERRRGRRRQEVLERAEREAGVDRELAEQVYDVAWEEGVEPAFAMELVRCGVAVCGPEPEMPGDVEIQLGPPPWLAAPLPADAAERERRLRMSFRRLRRLLESHATAEEALVAFVREPDVDECGY